uniref:Putative reverse transcriptase domain-containing protein n=1 Tax=Tanacetum cinerariifolium TaxID=118510 RepID=A0A6L2MU73_TANCI|nr:putative reverse transcriptase domain-containing protein [Tanacetum cinerariifolium]
MSGYIVGISKPSNTKSKTEVIEGLVLDAELMDHVFKVPVTTVKCISHGCRLAFSQVLKIVLYNVVSHPNYVDAWVSGEVPPILAEFVASAPVTPLFKPDNEIQPVEVSTIWRRLVSKVAMKGVGNEMSKYFSDFQFEVEVSGGADVVLHNINRFLSEYHNDGSLAMLTVDISNVFNLVDRLTLLHEVKVRPSLGVKLLRGAVSRDVDCISGMTIRRAVNAVDLMSFLPQLHAPHCELLLLRSCMGISKLFFDLRTCQPVHMKEAALFFDKGLRGSIKNIMKKWLLPMFLWSRGPNLGCYKTTSYMTVTYVDMEVHFDMTVRQNALFECLRALHAQDFLLPIHIDGIGQHMSSVEYRTILKRAEISTMKEAPVNFLIDLRDERSALRATDVLIFGWVGGKHACVDLTGVSPLVGLSSRGFTVGQTALKAASCKVTKHEKASIENQHMFILSRLIHLISLHLRR